LRDAVLLVLLVLLVALGNSRTGLVTLWRSGFCPGLASITVLRLTGSSINSSTWFG